MAVFLSASTPLTKSYTLSKTNQLTKSSYPHVANFTSHEENTPDLNTLYVALKRHAAEGHCLLKGNIARPLVNESRAGSTDRNATTTDILLDVDKAPFKTAHDFMKLIGLADISHIVQYSASMGIDPDARLSCHIFVKLDRPVQATLLKQWLMHLNLTIPELREALTLSRTGAALHWPLDITTCQNDKLIYVAPPVLKGIDDPYPAGRIQLIHRKQATLAAQSLKFPSLEALKKDAKSVLNALRKEAGYEVLRSQTKFIGEYEVQPKPGEAVITGIKQERDHVYLNLNGGDSWGYYHPIGNFELIHNFKGEPVYQTKELLPGYYSDCLAERQADAQQPTEKGDIILAFRDFRTAQYWNGKWNPGTFNLDLAPAKSELQLAHYMDVHGKTLPDAVPVWDMVFDMESDIIVDETNRVCNTYIPSEFYRMKRDKTVDELPPITKRIFESAIGTGEILDHWLNWIATAIQQPGNKIGTSWVLHGCPGTGKGLLCHNILAPLIGRDYVVPKRAKELQENYNGYIERARVVFVDEVKVPKSQNAEFVAEDVKNMITEPRLSIRHMYRPAYTAKNFTLFIFASNDAHPVYIAPGDRRFNVGNRQTEKLKITAKEIKALEKELPQLFQFLMNYEIDADLARTVLHTHDRELIINNGRTSLDMVADALKEGDFQLFWDAMPSDEMLGASVSADAIGARYKEIMEQILIQREKRTNLTREDLWVLFSRCVGDLPSSPSKFSRLLGHHQIEIKPVMKNDKIQRGIQVEWQYDRAWFEERRAELFKQNPKLKEVA